MDDYLSEIVKIKDRTEYILKTYPDTRNSDKLLVKKYWEVFDEFFIDADHERLFEITHFSSVVRCRAHCQNTMGLYRADKQIEKEREIKKDAMHAGFNPADEGQI